MYLQIVGCVNMSSLLSDSSNFSCKYDTVEQWMGRSSVLYGMYQWSMCSSGPAVQTWNEIAPDVVVLLHTLLINNALFCAESRQNALLLHGCSQVMLINASRWAVTSKGLNNEEEHLPRRLMQPICSQVRKSLSMQQFFYSSEIIHMY